MHAPENSGEPVPLLVSRQARQADSQINAGGVMIGGGSFALIAGPCAVENREQLFAAAAAVRSAGGVMPVSYTHLDVYKRQVIMNSLRRIAEFLEVPG